MPHEPRVTIIDPKRVQGLDIERLMSELPEGYKLQVNRETPIWCEGNCITQDIDPDEPISMESIRQRWGGQRLIIKILNPDGTYLKSKTVKFPDPPKKDGVELVLNTQGVPVRKDELERIENPPPPPQDTSALSMIQHLLTLQSRQNESMQALLSQRVNHLEQLLEKRSGPSAETGQGGGLFDGVRDTIRAIKEVETLRAAMQINNPSAAPAEGFAAWQPSIEKLIDFGLEMQRAKLDATTQAKKVPALPSAQAPRLLPVEELISQVQARLQGVDPETKRQIIAQVLGDDIDDIDDDDEDDENDNEDPTCTDSVQGVGLNLLSENDRAILGQNGGDSKSS